MPQGTPTQKTCHYDSQVHGLIWWSLIDSVFMRVTNPISAGALSPLFAILDNSNNQVYQPVDRGTGKSRHVIELHSQKITLEFSKVDDATQSFNVTVTVEPRSL